MNPVDYALGELKRRIPKQILEACFVETRGFGELWNKMPVSIDYRIREEVIESRVLVDANLMGGQDTHISLDGVPPEYLPDNRTLWRIPLEKTDNKRIVVADSIVQSSTQNGGSVATLGSDGSMVAGAARGLYTSHAPIANISSAQIRLVGENVVLADELYPYTPNLMLKCTLENDVDLNNLTRRAYPKFAKLVELAVKSHLHNELSIAINLSEITAGQELGSFSNFIEEYADAEEMYQEYLTTTWAKVAIFSDPESKRRHLEMLFSRQ